MNPYFKFYNWHFWGIGKDLRRSQKMLKGYHGITLIWTLHLLQLPLMVLVSVNNFIKKLTLLWWVSIKIASKEFFNYFQTSTQFVTFVFEPLLSGIVSAYHPTALGSNPMDKSMLFQIKSKWNICHLNWLWKGKIKRKVAGIGPFFKTYTFI